MNVGPTWIKSSRCDGGACVETARTPGAMLVRDGKDRGAPGLMFEPPAWRAFVAGVKAGAFE